MRQEQALDREGRAAWRDIQKMQAQADAKLTKMQAKADAQRKQAEEKKRADEIQMSKIEADKELTLKEMDLKAQAQTSTNVVVDPHPPDRDANSRSYQPS